MGKQPHRPVEVLPPAQGVIEACAEQVCQGMAEAHDQGFAHPEIVQGLAEFLRISARIQAKFLNSSVSVDNDAE